MGGQKARLLPAALINKRPQKPKQEYPQSHQIVTYPLDGANRGEVAAVLYLDIRMFRGFPACQFSRFGRILCR